MTAMARPALRKDLASMLNDATDKFELTDLDRHLDLAARDLSRVRPRQVQGTLTLAAYTREYAAPADLLRPLFYFWGRAEQKLRKPWDTDWPGVLPNLGMIEISGARYLTLDPCPTPAQIAELGASFAYMYSGKYLIDDIAANTNVPEQWRDLLLIRACSQALTELANKGIVKPVLIGPANVSMPKNGTPAALAGELLKLFERMAA